MHSSKPYLMRALYEWILDGNCTPYIAVNALSHGVMVPQQHVKDGQIVLNIAPTAVVGLLIDKSAVAFNARFGGVPTEVYVPMYAVLGIYAKENGRGMMFEAEAEPEPEATPPPSAGNGSKKSQSNKPVLRVVK
jgi:stringent starvation protein B